MVLLRKRWTWIKIIYCWTFCSAIPNCSDIQIFSCFYALLSASTKLFNFRKVQLASSKNMSIIHRLGSLYDLFSQRHHCFSNSVNFNWKYFLVRSSQAIKCHYPNYLFGVPSLCFFSNFQWKSYCFLIHLFLRFDRLINRLESNFDPGWECSLMNISHLRKNHFVNFEVKFSQSYFCNLEPNFPFFLFLNSKKKNYTLFSQ